MSNLKTFMQNDDFFRQVVGWEEDSLLFSFKRKISKRGLFPTTLLGFLYSWNLISSSTETAFVHN